MSVADGSRLGFVALGANRAIALPQIDDGIRGGVVLAGQPLPQGGGRLARDEGAQGLEVQELFHEWRDPSAAAPRAATAWRAA